MKRQSTIRLVVADDHRIIREGVVRLLADCPGLAIVAEAEDGEAALVAVLRYQPDVLVLDISMPRLNGFGVVDRLEAMDAPQPRVVLLTMHDELPYLIGASRPGVHGFVLKQAGIEELVRAIREVHAGKRYMGTRANTLRAMRGPLTPREIDVLRCAAHGLTIQGSAQQLEISEKTVETHRAHILRKLHAANITTAVHMMDDVLNDPPCVAVALAKAPGPGAT